MAWLDLRTEVALEFIDVEQDMDMVMEVYCAEARCRDAERARENYERCKYDPAWLKRHREQSWMEFHLAGYGRRHAGRELRALSAGQLRLLTDDICESRVVNLHAEQFKAALQVTPMQRKPQYARRAFGTQLSLWSQR
jgi:hypothetical protein